MMELDLATILIFAAVLLLTAFLTLKPKSDIPGPTAWPIIGNLFLLSKMQESGKIIQCTKELVKKYGSIFRLYLGPHQVVYVSDYNNIRTVLKDKAHDFVDRPSWLPAVKNGQKIKKGDGLVWANGDLWKNVRRLSLSSMRDFGVGKTTLEEKILEEAENVIAVLEKSDGKPITNVREIMTKASCNVIHHIIFGYRYQHDDPKYQELIDSFKKLFSQTGALSASTIFPLINLLYPGKTLNQRQALTALVKYLSVQVKEHEDSFDETNIRDFVDLYIKSEKLNSEGKKTNEKNELFSVIIDLFAAGTDTTSTSIDWALLYMIAYPEIQMKCQEEIARVVGSGRMIRSADRQNLWYVEATLLEVQRLGNTASGTVPHMASCDTTIGGYKVQKGTIVLSLLSHVHQDSAFWPNPEKFDPNRFLDNNNSIVKKEGLMPFGVGPRACPGESLAKTELFLIFSNILQRFTLSKADPKDELSFDGITRITTTAPPYRLTAIAR